LDVRQLTDVCHCNLQQHLSCNRHGKTVPLGPAASPLYVMLAFPPDLLEAP
jgi:hypothetical protein